MCYSALIRADYATLVREFGAILSLEEFAELYAHDPGKKRPKTPKAMDDGFAGARTGQGRDIVAKIQHWHALERQVLEAELAGQRERRDIAHATLATRPPRRHATTCAWPATASNAPRPGSKTCTGSNYCRATTAFSPAPTRR